MVDTGALAGAGGMAGGAAIGTAIMPGAGTLVGAGVGAMVGSAFSGKPKQYGFSPGDLERLYGQRESEINSFESQLAAMRTQYLNQIPQLQSATLRRFMPDIESNLAGRGLDVNSGAYASALARETAGMQAGLIGDAYQSGVSGASAVNNARAQAFGIIGAGAGQNISEPVPDPSSAAFGRLGGSLLSLGMMKMGTPGMPNSPMASTAASTEPASWGGLYGAGSTAAAGTSLAGRSMMTGEGF